VLAEEIYEQHYEVRLEQQNQRKGSPREKAWEKRESWCASLSGEDCCEKQRACDAKRKMGEEQHWEEVEMALVLRWDFLAQVMNEMI